MQEQPSLPPAYRPEFAEQARKLCLLLGATNDELARFLEVTPQTLADWLESVPAFARAVESGRLLADANVADSLLRCALGYSQEKEKVYRPSSGSEPITAKYTEYYPPDPEVGSYWLENRQPQAWRKKIEVEATHRHARDYKDRELDSIVAGGGGSRAATSKDDPQ